MRLNTFTKKIIFDYLTSRMQHIYSKRILKIMKMNHIPVKKVAGEEKFLEKWKRLSDNVDVNYYRCYSAYIGMDVNILPEDINYNIIEPILNPCKFRGFYGDKNMFDRVLPKEYLPQTVLRNINGSFYDADYVSIPLLSDEKLFSFLHSHDKVIVKPAMETCSGFGVFVFQKKADGVYENREGKRLDVEYLMQQYGKNYIIQECLQQHEMLASLNSSSVITLRVCTYRSVKTQEGIVTNIVLRVGKRGAEVDNIHAGGVLFGISSVGKISSYGVNQWGERVTSFNGIDYESKDLFIPDIDKVIVFAKEISQRVLHHRVLNLDIVLDKTGSPKLLEYNVRDMGVWAFQFTTGSVFGEYTDEVIDYCAEHLEERSLALGINE